MSVNKFKSIYSILFLLCSCVCVNAAVRRMEEPIYHMDFSDIETQSPINEDIKDIRSDGISYYATRASCTQYLQHISSEEQLDDFSKPGFHHVMIQHDDEGDVASGERFLRCILNAGIHSNSTWEIALTGWLYDYESVELNVTLLSEFFIATPEITTLHWSAGYPIPRDLLSLLESQHPTCKLDYGSLFDHRRYAYPRGTEDEKRKELTEEESRKERERASESIMNSTILHSLRTGVEYGMYPETGRMDFIHRVLISCPNIRELTLSVRHFGCVFSSGQPYGFNFEKRKGSMPPLESLTLDGYNFGGKPNGQEWMEWEADKPQQGILNFPWSSLPSSVIEYIGYAKIKSLGGLDVNFVKRDTSPLKPGEKTNLDMWLEVMDWTRLHTLSLRNPAQYELQKLSGRTLPNLKNVDFDGGNRIATAEFLRNTSSSLESISIKSNCVCSPDDILDVVYTHHCPALKELRLGREKIDYDYYEFQHGSEPYHYPRDTFFNSTHLSQLLNACPDLHALDIDLYLGGGWDYDTLDAIAAFPELTTLTLRIEAFVSRASRMYDLQRGMQDENEKIILAGLGAYLRKVKKGKNFKSLKTIVNGNDM